MTAQYNRPEFEQPPFGEPQFKDDIDDFSVATGRIDDPDLANVVGYAEKDNTEASREAFRAGRFEEAAGLIALADAAGKYAAIAYLNDLNFQVGNKDAAVETEKGLEQWAQEVALALSERYNISPNDFSLIKYELNGDRFAAVAHTAPNGIDMGDPQNYEDPRRSWKVVMSRNWRNAARHRIVIGKVKWDDRKGMTYALYNALVEKAKAEGRELPDSIDNEFDDGKFATWTLMTGEPLTPRGNAQLAGVGDDGRVIHDWVGAEEGVRHSIRFRPAVVRFIEELR